MTRNALGALVVAMGVVLASACTPPNIAGDPLKGTTSGEAFPGVQCTAVRPQTEPDLMAWDPGSRSNLNRLRREGVVAVRYEAKGCNVELELLSNCIGTKSKYAFSPYSANERKIAHNANELFAQLPVGAARLGGAVKGNRILRTDYMMAGQYALPAGSTFDAADLHGPDCARATHVVSAVYVGGFAMGAGESRSMEASATLFGARAGGKSTADVEVLGDEGDAEACKSSQKDGKESDQCAVPLRIGLLALDGRTPPARETPRPGNQTQSRARGLAYAEAIPRPPATKPTPADEATAKRNFEAGLKLFGEGALPQALIAFEQSYRLGGRPAALKNIAQCHRDLKHFVETYEAYDQMLTAHEAQLTAADKTAFKLALEELSILTGTLLVNVSAIDAEIEIDGKSAGRSPMAKPQRVGVASHVVRVTKNGFAPFEHSVNVGSQDNAKLDVALEPEKTTGRL